MKRRGYFLAEMLMGMTLQAVLALSLLGAFYMLLTFSSSLAKTLEGYDRGQIVISYVDTRIRNAGTGLWNCTLGTAANPSPAGVSDAFDISLTHWPSLNGSSGRSYHLPVAITSSSDSRGERLSHDARYYEGNILTLLYAHKDYAQANNLLVLYADSTDAVTIPAGHASPDFKFINYTKDYTSKTNDNNFELDNCADKTNKLKHWAVIEASGLPVMISDFGNSTHYSFTLTAPNNHPVTIYPMSELLPIEIKRMLVVPDSDGYRNFTFFNPNDNLNRSFTGPYYHVKDILEVYFRLDTKPTTASPVTPILDMKVLVNDGERESEDIKCPPDWPAAYWQESFGKYNYHIEQAQWRLYNLTGWVFP